MQDNVVSVEGINYKYITDIRFHKSVNEHGDATVRCVIEDKDVDSVLALKTEVVWVTVKIGETIGEKADTPVFTGIIDEISVDTIQGVSEVCIELVGGSYLLDIKKITRTYQNEESKLSNVMGEVKKNCLKMFSGASAMINKGKECDDSFQPKGDLLVQYEETDYEFLKRCASMQGMPLITSINSTEDTCVNINVGLITSGKTEKVDTKYFRQGRQVAKYIEDKRAGLDGISEKDYSTISIRCRDYFDIGSAVNINGKTMYVYSVDSVYDSSHNIRKSSSNINKDEFWHVYLLAGEKRFKTPQLYNFKMIGASLRAEVKKVSKAKLEVVCDIDKINGTTAKNPLEFPYATVYSTDDGTGWYCMPEEKDVVRLYIPTEFEKDAYVISAVHLEEGTGLRNDPTHKFIMNKYKKQVEFTKDTIRISNNDGMEIRLEDEKGIFILSDKDIKIDAQKEINLVSKKDQVNINGTSQIKLQANPAYIDLKDTATIKAANVKF